MEIDHNLQDEIRLGGNDRRESAKISQSVSCRARRLYVRHGQLGFRKRVEEMIVGVHM